MLRCPPTRINLTAADIADFEWRYATRRNKGKTAKLRLSPGPAHPARLSFVPAEHNIGRQRALSSSSEATIHNGDDREGFSSPACSPSTEQADRALNTLLQRPNLTAATPRRQVDSFYGTEQVLDLRPTNDGPAPPPSFVDGTTEGRLYHTPEATQSHLRAQRGYGRLGEIHSDAFPTDRQPRTEPPLLASARARRRQARSQDVQMFKEPDAVQEMMIRAHDHGTTVEVTQSNITAFQVPDLVLPIEDSVISYNAPLDPGAPVFMPRTRFGTVTGSSQDASHLPFHGADYNSDLRLRSSSEQNADHRSHRPRQQHMSPSTDTASSFAPRPTEGLRRRRSRTADQNIALPNTVPTLDGYPLMQPVFSGSEQAIRHGPGWRSQAQSGNAQRITRHLQSNNTTGQDDVHLQVRQISNAVDSVHDRGHFPSISPALSTSSRSTPNLLQHPIFTPPFNVRGSSLPWNRDDSRMSSFSRVPSMISAASGISDRPQASRQSSREGLDAAIEFLRMRNSPLDELTEQFSRMSAARPRSCGRSWERPPQPRVSLLAGDPFRPEPPPVAPPGAHPIPSHVVMRTELPDAVENPEVEAEDLVALSLALPPSSPLRSSSIPLPTTPSLHLSHQKSPHSLVDDGPMKKSPESSIKRKPVPTPTATPKVPVYDDAKPRNSQPQTPADIRGSKRRAKTRSDSSVQQPPIYVDQTMISSPPPIPERHPHRNTYPSNGPALNLADTSGPPSTPHIMSMNQGFAGPHHRARNQGRFRAQRSSQQAENDLEGHLHGLEEDRRTWCSRREGGNLDVTPPREGRFERYLS